MPPAVQRAHTLAAVRTDASGGLLGGLAAGVAAACIPPPGLILPTACKGPAPPSPRSWQTASVILSPQSVPMLVQGLMGSPMMFNPCSQKTARQKQPGAGRGRRESLSCEGKQMECHSSSQECGSYDRLCRAVHTCAAKTCQSTLARLVLTARQTVGGAVRQSAGASNQ